jgi:hypothetical protein
MWLSGSGGTVETPYQLSRHFWQNAHESQAVEPLSAEAGVGRVHAF